MACDLCKREKATSTVLLRKEGTTDTKDAKLCGDCESDVENYNKGVDVDWTFQE